MAPAYVVNQAFSHIMWNFSAPNVRHLSLCHLRYAPPPPTQWRTPPQTAAPPPPPTQWKTPPQTAAPSTDVWRGQRIQIRPIKLTGWCNAGTNICLRPHYKHTSVSGWVGTGWGGGYYSTRGIIPLEPHLAAQCQTQPALARESDELWDWQELRLRGWGGALWRWTVHVCVHRTKQHGQIQTFKNAKHSIN